MSHAGFAALVTTENGFRRHSPFSIFGSNPESIEPYQQNAAANSKIAIITYCNIIL